MTKYVWEAARQYPELNHLTSDTQAFDAWTSVVIDEYDHGGGSVRAYCFADGGVLARAKPMVGLSNL